MHKGQVKNIDEWVEWMARNPQLAEKYYPELMQGLTERIKNSEPFLTALIIQKIPVYFPTWKKEAEQYFGITRTKMIQGYIDLIKTVLIEYEYPTEIEQEAVESVRAELTEQLEYWENELISIGERTEKQKGNMIFLEIVLDGYFNENNREHLEKYFLREYKKAEKEHYFEANEFFSGCNKVVDSWEKHLQDKVFERKRQLYLMLNGAKNGTLSYSNMEGKTIEQKRQETIEFCEQELKDVRPDGIGSLSFTVHLSSLTNGRIAYNMKYSEVLKIKLAIHKAFQKSQSNIEPLPPQPITTQKTESLSDIITHEKSIDIVEGIKIQYKNIKGKRLKLLLLAFQDLELLPKERIAKKFHDCCKNEFNWDIASYNAMNGYLYNNTIDSVEFNSMKQYLETLIKTK